MLSFRHARIPVRRFTQLVKRDPNQITLKHLESASDQDVNAQIELIQTISKSSNTQKRELIAHLIPNFSLYFKLKPVAEAFSSGDILTRFIEVNPGRVHNTWDLFKAHEQDLAQIDSQTVSLVLEKLVNGEISELQALEEGEKFQIDPSSLDKIEYLLKTYGSSDEKALSGLFDRLVEDGHSDFVKSVLSNELVSGDFMSKYLQKQVSDAGFLLTLHKVFYTNPQTIKFETLADSLDKIFFGKQQNSDFAPLGEDIVSFVESGKLDLDERPESLLLRLKIIEVYGVFHADVDKTLQKFHQYQTHAKFGIDLVQHNVYKSFMYQAVNQDKEIYLTIGKTVLPAEEISVKALQLSIVANAHFNIESALEVYNDYIQKVSKKTNEHTKRSGSGLLTEALILGNLHDNDRSFATLILEKAVQNDVVSDELEIAQIKNLYKAYGASFVEDDDWEKAKLIFKQFVLDYMKGL